MKLYYSDVLQPRKVCAAARYLKSPVEFVYVDLQKGENRTAEYGEINPNRKVPALVDGPRRMWEANAIMAYLADRAVSDLWPRDDRQFEVLRWMSWETAHFNRHGGTLYFEHVVKARFGIGAPDPAAVEEATGFFRRFAQVLDDHLAGRRWLVGDGLTIADFAVAVCLPHAEAAQIPLGDFPNVSRWHDRLNELEAWREPFPARVAVPA